MSAHDQILTPSQDRLTLFPIKFPTLWQLYEKAVGSYWTVKEIDMARDRTDFLQLSSDEQHFIKYILAFFANFDNVVNENLATRFCQEVQVSEARAFYYFQMAIEQTHAVTYALQIETLVTDAEEKDRIQHAVSTIPAIKGMAEWALRWISPSKSTFGQRLVAFAIIEGVVFSGAFCAIYWIGYHKKKCPGLTQANDLIARDERLHTEFACELHKLLAPENQATPEQILEILLEALPPIENFITESLPYDIPLMNAHLMKQYIHFVADRLLAMLNQPPYFKVTNPFAFMEGISFNKQVNFFEHPPTEYASRTAQVDTILVPSIDDIM